METWKSANSLAIQQNGITPLYFISSWAIVVDLQWKAAFKNVRNINAANDALLPQTPLTDANY
jgi:hypothetical protein